MNKLILVCLTLVLTGCGGSSNSSSSSNEDIKEKMVERCMKSAGVDVDNPNDNVSMEQLAKIENCLGN